MGKVIMSGVGAKVAKPMGLPAVGGILADYTPEEIKIVAKAGLGANYWSVGDKISIRLLGTIASLAIDGYCYAFIIGFNHNSTIEGTHSIHFQFGKTSTGDDIAFVKNYNSSGTGFCMNTSNTNSGGWESSHMRNTICEAFYSALPPIWREIVVACTKYTDNTGGGSNTASYVTTTSDKIWLLSEFELRGSKSYSNNAEQNYQMQYEYYKAGNSKVKYRHDSISSACNWWLRSVAASYNNGFCTVNTSGSAYMKDAYTSCGFAPAFAIA